MAAVRTVLTALIAISVAGMPATGRTAVPTTPVEMSMPDNANMPCCPSCNDQDNSKSSVACALKCINFVAAVLPAMVDTELHLVDATPPSFVGSVLREHMSSPPTHPPPV
jgi:hypothetical protein